MYSSESDARQDHGGLRPVLRLGRMWQEVYIKFPCISDAVRSLGSSVSKTRVCPSSSLTTTDHEIWLTTAMKYLAIMWERKLLYSQLFISFPAVLTVILVALYRATCIVTAYVWLWCCCCCCCLCSRADAKLENLITSGDTCCWCCRAAKACSVVVMCSVC